MEGTKPRTASSIGMFDMLKGAGMLTIVFAHTAELYPMQAVSGLSLTAFFPFIYREALMAAFFIASGYGFRKRSIHKCIHQQLKSLLKPYAYTASLSRSPAAFCWACPTRPSISGRSSSPAGRCGICWR